MAVASADAGAAYVPLSIAPAKTAASVVLPRRSRKSPRTYHIAPRTRLVLLGLRTIDNLGSYGNHRSPLGAGGSSVARCCGFQCWPAWRLRVDSVRAYATFTEAETARVMCPTRQRALYEGKDPSGGHVDLDYAKARQAFTAGCKRDDAPAVSDWETMLDKGEGGERDKVLAVELWRHKGELGDGISCNKTAELHDWLPSGSRTTTSRLPMPRPAVSSATSARVCCGKSSVERRACWWRRWEVSWRR